MGKSSAEKRQATSRLDLRYFVLLLKPGVRIKRWLLIGGLGLLVVAFGLAYLVRYFIDLPGSSLLITYLVSSLVVIAGITLVGIGVVGLFSRLYPVLRRARRAPSLPQALYQLDRQEHGPRIVAIGGGTGLSTLLRGLKEHQGQITAIVTVADDGGSSGRLRREMGILPPGDFRNCIVALSDEEPLMQRLFQYRFSVGSGLEGHSFGNLFIVAMSAVTGSFEKAIHESSRILATRGRILPSTLTSLSLSAGMKDGSLVLGESNITQYGGRIKRLYVDPPDAPAYSEAVEAILQAQLIVIGPGSIYTSILPNLMVSGIRDAVARSAAVKIFVCNVATQPGETDGYGVADHIEAMRQHTGSLPVSYVLVNRRVSTKDWSFPAQPVVWDRKLIKEAEVVEEDLADESFPIHHDPMKLAEALMKIYYNGARTNHRKQQAVPSGSGTVERIVE